MRVGIDYRILTVGRDLMRRGLGRYTQQQLRAVLDDDPGNEYVVICEPGADTSLVDPAIRAAPNTSVRRVPPSVSVGAGDREGRLRRGEAFQRWVLELGVDVFHATTPFYPSEPFLATFDACPMVATFYDLIPLLYPTHYFLGEADREMYARSLSLVRRADRLIAISAASGQEAVSRLGVAADRIDVAYPALDPCFDVLGEKETGDILAGLARRVPLPERFVLSVSFPHHAKNLDTLLAAFARLPPEVRMGHPLVLCCTLSRAGQVIWAMADALGIGDDVVVTGPVSDPELVALYNAATFVVHPSRYEGFGLPVVEAMRCGTPVITTTSSSLPEAGGDAAVLVDPDDVQGLADAMLELHDDPGRGDEMVRRGLAHSAAFDLHSLARATLDTYRKAVSGAPDGGGRRPRIAVWGPVPPDGDGAGDITGDLVAGLRDRCLVEVFVDDGVVPSLEVLGLEPVLHHSAYDRRNAAARFDMTVYQVGESPLYAYERGPMHDHPGLVLVYSSSWSHALHAAFAARGELDRFYAELADLEGHQAVDELRALKEEPDGWPVAGPSDHDFWASHPMLGPVVDASLVQVVHSSDLAADLKERYATAAVRTVPLGVADPLAAHPSVDAVAAKAGLGYRAETFVVGVPASTPLPDVELCVRAVAELGAEPVGVVLLALDGLQGEGEHEGINRLAASLGVDSDLTRPGAGEEPTNRLIACDAVVVLGRGSTRSMVTALRALAAGKPLVVSSTAPWSFYPEDVCRRLPPGAALLSLSGELRRLQGDVELRARLSARARSYYEGHATVAGAGAALLQVVEEVAARPMASEGHEEPGVSPSTWAALVRALAT